MPTPTITRFSAFEFTEEELKSAAVFNDLQKKYLQTQLAGIAEQLINMDCSEKSKQDDYEVQRSFLKGQMTMIQHLLDSSDRLEIQIETEIQEAVNRSAVVDVPGPNLYQHFRGDPRN